MVFPSNALWTLPAYLAAGYASERLNKYCTYQAILAYGLDCGQPLFGLSKPLGSTLDDLILAAYLAGMLTLTEPLGLAGALLLLCIYCLQFEITLFARGVQEMYNLREQ